MAVPSEGPVYDFLNPVREDGFVIQWYLIQYWLGVVVFQDTVHVPHHRAVLPGLEGLTYQGVLCRTSMRAWAR